MRQKITVIGSMNYDIVMKMSRLPERGETLTVDDIAFSGGGKGANQAVQASKLGVDTYMAGCVGEDFYGDYLLSNLEKYKVNTSHVRRCKENTGIGVVQALKDGNVYASISHGANYKLTKQDVDALEDILQESELLILQMEIPQEVNEYAIEKARDCGCRVLLNAAPAAEIPESYIKQCSIFVVNEVEAAFYLQTPVKTVEQAEQGAQKLFQDYGSDVIITLGSQGSVVCEKGQVTFIPPKHVKAVESTGAGDSFIGALGYALLQGVSLSESCSFATKCSAKTVCRLGAQDAMPTLEEVQ